MTDSTTPNATAPEANPKLQAFRQMLRVADWLIPLPLLAYGAWTGDLVWMAIGVSGLILAYINPGKRLETRLRNKLLGPQ